LSSAAAAPVAATKPTTADTPKRSNAPQQPIVKHDQKSFISKQDYFSSSIEYQAALTTAQGEGNMLQS
jgi:hypothetical protein